MLNRALHKDAVRIFKVIQRSMGDREESSIGGRRTGGDHLSASALHSSNGSTTSLTGHSVAVLEEKRWLLTEALAHGELRDEIYCQVMKQLVGNPSP